MSTGQDIEPDVVIIGSGVAGALTACKLAAQGVTRIVVLEAGPRIDRGEIVRNFMQKPRQDVSAGFPSVSWAPRPDSLDSKDDYIEHIGPEVAQNQWLRVVGGTTWAWSANTPRHLPVDFRLRTAYGVGIDWPLHY